VELTLPMEVTFSNWYERAAGIEWGTLVFALKIGESWEQINDDSLRPTYQVKPTSPWNYALLYQNFENMNEHFIVEKQDVVADNPWNLQNSPVKIITTAKRLDSWKQYGGDHGPIQYSKYWYPQTINAPEEKVELIPYGCTTLRISEFPVMK